MSAPQIWIMTPLVMAILLWVFQYHQRVVYIVALIFTLFLAWMAWQIPIDQTTTIGPWTFRIAPTLTILGRTFTLDAGDKAFLLLIFLNTGLWFAWSRFAKTHRYFIPLSLAIIALLVAALAVEPFLYAALLIEIAVLISVPMLAPPGKKPGQAILRYVIFQTLALPFILFTGWMLSSVESSPTEIALTVRAGIMLGLGFAFLLAVFPFYTWIPLLAEQSHPYVAGFVLTTLQTIVLLFAVTFMEKFTWLRTSTQLFEIVRLTGGLMIVTGGLWAAFQKHLGRLLGYALIIETGFALLSISTFPQGGAGAFAILFLPRLIAVGIWTLAISLLAGRTGTIELPNLQGIGRRLRFISASLVFAQFSLAGLPLLASFPVKQAILAQVADASVSLTTAAFLGSAGLLIGVFRTIEVLIHVPKDETIAGLIGESIGEKAVLAIGVIFLVLIGLAPQVFAGTMMNLLKAFPSLVW